ncbi:MAG: hypothetical protein EOR96_00040 [Mesorhizobium sp.]|nr:MAG: hypothetical protein EOR96_00040 [Mesorhizobium sp.]
MTADIIEFSFVEMWRYLDRRPQIEIGQHPTRQNRFYVTAAGMGWSIAKHWSNFKSLDAAMAKALEVQAEWPGAEIDVIPLDECREFFAKTGDAA